ncbi:type II toxin-antitoxin system RelE/ParE family toxin [Novispirillum sp. DQ9]|uniref:type II toxin-antitoxin system RelE/ParE family toxin n=1 Tax=Novispirillum sp. DQ9 TaxID=3398612 RepID=UPI003C7A3B4F
MIIGFRHKGLKLRYDTGDRRRVPSEYAGKIERVLARLDVATVPEDMNLPGFRLHPLKGGLAGFWAVSVSGNWRVIFRFDGAHACDVDLVDYH